MFRLLLMTKPRSRYHEFFWPLQKTSNLEKYADIIMYCHILILDFRVQFSQWKDYPNWLIYFNSYCVGPPITLLAIAIKISVKSGKDMYRELFGVSIQQFQTKPTILPSIINPVIINPILTSSPTPDVPPCCSHKWQSSSNPTNPSNPIKYGDYNCSVNSANNANLVASANPTKSVNSLNLFSPLGVDILTILVPLDNPTTLIDKLNTST